MSDRICTLGWNIRNILSHPSIEVGRFANVMEFLESGDVDVVGLDGKQVMELVRPSSCRAKTRSATSLLPSAPRTAETSIHIPSQFRQFVQ